MLKNVEEKISIDTVHLHGHMYSHWERRKIANIHIAFQVGSQ